jgi:RNA polymerase-binding protein DksA
MSKENLDYFRSILLERRKFILETIERLREMSNAREGEFEFNEKYSNHLADQSGDSMGKEESFMFISRELQYLYQINNSLKSVDSGQYGKCNICGKKIPKARLELVPTTDICINCKNTHLKRRYLN